MSDLNDSDALRAAAAELRPVMPTLFQRGATVFCPVQLVMPTEVAAPFAAAAAHGLRCVLGARTAELITGIQELSRLSDEIATGAATSFGRAARARARRDQLAAELRRKQQVLDGLRVLLTRTGRELASFVAFRDGRPALVGPDFDILPLVGR
jgi:hypothetical protein